MVRVAELETALEMGAIALVLHGMQTLLQGWSQLDASVRQLQGGSADVTVAMHDLQIAGEHVHEAIHKSLVYVARRGAAQAAMGPEPYGVARQTAEDAPDPARAPSIEAERHRRSAHPRERCHFPTAIRPPWRIGVRCRAAMEATVVGNARSGAVLQSNGSARTSPWPVPQRCQLRTLWRGSQLAYGARHHG